MTIESTEHKDQEAFQESDEFKEQAKSHYKIEAKNSELKHRHGYDVATSAGLFGMQIQGMHKEKTPIRSKSNELASF